MNESWNKAVIREVFACIYVPKGSGRVFHTNRPLHGLVLNRLDAERDYLFSDGRVMHTTGGSLFYLPKGSTYEARSLQGEIEAKMQGACYCINFDADIECEPFSFVCTKYEEVLHDFKVAERSWRENDACRFSLAMRTLYNCIYRIQKERERLYLPNKTQMLLAPAIKRLKEGFAQNSLTVSELSSLCGMSEVYFRRLFMSCYGTSPKEYIIERRISYAKSLLASGDFSVGEVAMLCGYAEPCHFSREFARRTGISPAQFAKEGR